MAATLKQTLDSYGLWESAIARQRKDLVRFGRQLVAGGERLPVELVKAYDGERRLLASRTRALAEQINEASPGTIDPAALEQAARAALLPLPNEIVPSGEKNNLAPPLADEPLNGLRGLGLAPLGVPLIVWLGTAIGTAGGAAYYVKRYYDQEELEARERLAATEAQTQYVVTRRKIYEDAIAAGEPPKVAAEIADEGAGDPPPPPPPAPGDFLDQIKNLAPWVIGGYLFFLLAPTIIRGITETLDDTRERRRRKLAGYRRTPRRLRARS